MNSPTSHKLFTRSLSAALVLGAALLSSACSTTSAAVKSSDKAFSSVTNKSEDRVVTYAVLHNDMLRLANESNSSDTERSGTASASLAGSLGGASLASNSR